MALSGENENGTRRSLFGRFSAAGAKKSFDRDSAVLSKFEKNFESSVRQARFNGFTERFWNRAVPTVGGLTGVFLTASWMGVWQASPAALRATGCALFLSALAYAIKPLLSIPVPTRKEALRRMDDLYADEMPASTYDAVRNNLTRAEQDGEDSFSWTFEKNRLEEQYKRFKTGRPRSDLDKHDPFKLRYAVLMATLVSGTNAVFHGHAFDDLAAITDWSVLPPYRGPLKVDMLMETPAYTGFDIIQETVASELEIRHEPVVPAKTAVNFVIHDSVAEVDVSGDVVFEGEICKKPAELNLLQCRFEVSGDAVLKVQRHKEPAYIWNITALPDNPPDVNIEVARGETGEAMEPLYVDVQTSDEYGTKETILTIDAPNDEAVEMPKKRDLYKNTKMRIPLQ